MQILSLQEFNKFPSPIGVIFFLISKRCLFWNSRWWIVSVSYRSYILSYEDYTDEVVFTGSIRISVSYRSYILSYFYNLDSYTTKDGIRFPSPIGVIFFLIKSLNLIIQSLILTIWNEIIVAITMSVSDRSYIRSCIFKMYLLQNSTILFPSPIGVIFFLIILT